MATVTAGRFHVLYLGNIANGPSLSTVIKFGVIMGHSIHCGTETCKIVSIEHSVRPQEKFFHVVSILIEYRVFDSQPVVLGDSDQ